MVNYNLYRLATFLVAPFVPLWLDWRRYKRKEDPVRLKERYGITNRTRPDGLLIWLHAASVGEATSVLTLMNNICQRFPDAHLLITTGTVTSAMMLQKRLPPNAFHQYVPVDTPSATRRFIRHWKPDIGFWVESELWPNLIHAARAYYCFIGIINGRMSERSFEMWKKYPAIARHMLESFSIVFPQSELDGERFAALGVRPNKILNVGNLKYDGAPLSCNEDQLLRMTSLVENRPHWLAASTHPGEEAMVAQVHQLLSITRPGLLTIIVPRHARRGAEIAQMLSAHGKVARRSKNEPITPDTQFYVADTMGELGLFYRLCDIVFIGGSLVPHGGQNPMEAARLSCGIVTGPHTKNFIDVYQEMEQVGACIRVQSAEGLAAQIDGLLNDSAKLAGMQDVARGWITGKGGATKGLLNILAPIFEARPV